MVGLALYFDFARRLGGLPPVIFNEVADRFAGCPTADLLQEFGARTDITLEAQPAIVLAPKSHLNIVDRASPQ